MHDDYQWLETEPILSTLLQFGRYKKLEIVLKSCYVFAVESVSQHSKFKYTKRQSHKRECAGRMEKNNFCPFFLLGFLGGVYMTPGRFSPLSEFTPVPSHGSTFVYMIPQQTVMPARVTPAWVHPGCCTVGRISLRYEISQRYHVNVKRPHVSVWNRSASGLERVAHA